MKFLIQILWKSFTLLYLAFNFFFDVPDLTGEERNYFGGNKMTILLAYGFLTELHLKTLRVFFVGWLLNVILRLNIKLRSFIWIFEKKWYVEKTGMLKN